MGVAASPFLNPIAAEPGFLPVLPDTPEYAAKTPTNCSRAPVARLTPPRHSRHRIIAA
jgi:hypothetical protein